MNPTFQTIPVAILCGGKGVVLDELGGRLNKALIPVNSMPLFWWVIAHYAACGAAEFVLAVGMQPERFRAALSGPCAALPDAIEPDCYQVQIAGHSCRIRLIETPTQASTAERLLACKPYLKAAERFALTYSDTLSDVDLDAELAFHQSSGRIATLVGTQYPVRFRILGMRQGETIVRAFAPRPVIEAAAINGGYYLFTPAIWNAEWGLTEGVALENQPLERLAAAAQLAAYAHSGGWQHCDAERDLTGLDRLARQIAARLHA